MDDDQQSRLTGDLRRSRRLALALALPSLEEGAAALA
jgi:hypothetical protein